MAMNSSVFGVVASGCNIVWKQIIHKATTMRLHAIKYYNVGEWKRIFSQEVTGKSKY
jgi:hypothetical protein